MSERSSRMKPSSRKSTGDTVEAPIVAVADGEPTKPRPIDRNGRTLDAWGLPISGPARAAALAELGRGDPHFAPEDWPVEAEPLSDTSQSSNTGTAQGDSSVVDAEQKD